MNGATALAAAFLILHSISCIFVDGQQTTGIYRALMDKRRLFDGIDGEINVYVTDEALEAEVIGYNGFFRGLPIGLTDVRLVVHNEQSCESAELALRDDNGKAFNFTLPFVVQGEVSLSGVETFILDDNWGQRAVAVYLNNGTMVGCGLLDMIQDNQALEASVGSLPNQPGIQAEVTGFVSQDSSKFCYFSAISGLDASLTSADCTSPSGMANQCGIQIRSQNSCDEANLNQPLVGEGSTWMNSRYFWSDQAGFSAASGCIDAVSGTETLQGYTLIVYDPDGVAGGCGIVSDYKAPFTSPPLVETRRSQIYCAYLNNMEGESHFWGAVFAFQNVETIRNGVIGIAGHLYNTALCENSACELVLSSGMSCDDKQMETSRVLRFTTMSDGAFSGTWDVFNDDLEDELALLRLPNGTIASCNYLKEVPDSTVYRTKTLPYPGRSITGEILSTNAFNKDLCSFGFAYGLDPGLKDCAGACGYQVHEGKTCDAPAEPLFNKKKWGTSPWVLSRYTTTDFRGVTMFGGCVDTGLDAFEYAQRTMVIRGPDNIAASCGQMRRFKPVQYDGTCVLCPFGFEMSSPETLVSLGGPVDVTCEYAQQSGESQLFSSDDCINAQRTAWEFCGCAPNGIRATSETSNRPVAVSVSVAAVVVVLALAVSFFVIRRRSSQPKNNDGQMPAEDTPPAQQSTENETESRGDGEAEQLFPHMPTAIAVRQASVAATATGTTEHGKLTTKNQMRGGSFWDHQTVATPYADAVPIEDSMPSQRKTDISELSF